MIRTCAARFALWLSLALVALAPPASVSAQGKRSSGIRVETDLVNIIASVQDASGRPVPELDQDAFEVFEEDVAQKIERFEAETNRPLDLALMIDSSMSAYKELKFERETAAHFIRQVVRPGDTLSVFEFSDSVTQLSAFSSNVPLLQDAARRITLGTGTSLYDALVLGSQTLERRPEGRRRVIVLVTDAGETTSASKFEDARRNAIASGTLLYSIVVRPVKSESGRNTAGEHALITITDTTGGAMYFPDELAQLDAMFDRIDRELRTQYLLGYYPHPLPPAGSYRNVEVRVKNGYTVRYRKGYFTSGAPE